jgi:hypothetical protein
MRRPCTRCGERPGHALLRWGAVLALGLALEAEAVHCKRHHHTLSHATRKVYRVNTDKGQLAFSASWILFAAWFLRHIVKGDPV